MMAIGGVFIEKKIRVYLYICIYDRRRRRRREEEGENEIFMQRVYRATMNPTFPAAGNVAALSQ